MGGADYRELPRLRYFRTTSARAGFCGARDAEDSRGLRAEARHESRDAWTVESDLLAPYGRGEEAGVRRPICAQRRPEIRFGAGARIAVRETCGRIVRPDRSARGVEAECRRRKRRRNDLSHDG